MKPYAHYKRQTLKDDGQHHKIAGVIVYLACVSATCKEFKQPSPLAGGECHPPRVPVANMPGVAGSLYKQLRNIKAATANTGEGRTDESAPFDMATDLPKLWAANWGSDEGSRKQSLHKRVLTWAMLLVQQRERWLGLDGSGLDPIWSVWVWKECTEATDDGKNQLCM